MRNTVVPGIIPHNAGYLYTVSDIAEFSQIKEKLEKVVAKQHELSEKWDKHWEVLQQREYTYSFTNLQSNLLEM